MGMPKRIEKKDNYVGYEKKAFYEGEVFLS
jgi:hypothetical protein